MDPKAYRAALLMGWLGTAGILSLAYYLTRPAPPPRDDADAFFDLMREEADTARPLRHAGRHDFDPYPRRKK